MPTGSGREAGQHITLVDTITGDVHVPDEEEPKTKCLRITVGSGRSKVTATFFNANYIMKDLTEGTKVMLSGEVGFFRETSCS